MNPAGTLLFDCCVLNITFEPAVPSTWLLSCPNLTCTSYSVHFSVVKPHCEHDHANAELEKEVSGLQQALTEQKRLTKEAQASLQAAQQQAEEADSVRQELEQLRTASQAKDNELSSLKVIWHAAVGLSVSKGTRLSCSTTMASTCCSGDF